VVVCQHRDGWLSVYYGPHQVGRFASEDQEKKAVTKSCGKDAQTKAMTGYVEQRKTGERGHFTCQ
jgi:hypothetical protein